MDKEMVIDLVTEQMARIRKEKNYTQDRMIEVLGLSKRHLQQVEKNRLRLNWTQTAAVCALFRDSDILKGTLGDDPLEILEVVAHDELHLSVERTIGGKIWWRTSIKKGTFRLQQNVLSQHYRILDDENYRYYSSFNKEEAKRRLEELSQLSSPYS